MDSCLKITLCIDKEIEALEQQIEMQLEEEKNVKIINNNKLDEQDDEDEDYTPDESMDKK